MPKNLNLNFFKRAALINFHSISQAFLSLSLSLSISLSLSLSLSLTLGLVIIGWVNHAGLA
jgi:hypothetical protein